MNLSWLAGALTAIIVVGGMASAAERSITGSPLQITVSDVLAVRLQKSGVRQYFDTYNTFLRIGATTFHSCTAIASGFPNPPANPLVPVAQSQPDPMRIETTIAAGGLQVLHIASYLDGEASYRHVWTVSNPGAATVTGIRLLFGGDTYFENQDVAAGFWDPLLAMVYCNRAGASGLMGLGGDAATPPDAYMEGDFVSVWTALANGSLPSTVQPTNVDNGMALQWNVPDLAPGGSFTIGAVERWTAVDAWDNGQISAVISAGRSTGQPVSMVDGAHGKENSVGSADGLGPALGTPISQAEASTPADAVLFMLRFGSPVTGLEPGDLTVSGTAGGAVTSIEPPSGPADVYRIVVAGMTGPGTVELGLLAGSVQGLNGETNQASAGGDPVAFWQGPQTPADGSSCGTGGLGLLLLGFIVLPLRWRRD